MQLIEILKYLIELADKGMYGTEIFNSAWDTFYHRKNEATATEIEQALKYALENTEEKFENFQNPDYYVDALEYALNRNVVEIE